MCASAAVLLHGPAGSGKTTLLRAVAGAIGAPLVSLEAHLFGRAPFRPRDPARAAPCELHSAFESCLREAEMRGGGVVVLEKAERFLSSRPWLASSEDESDAAGHGDRPSGHPRGGGSGWGHDAEMFMRVHCWLSARSAPLGCAGDVGGEARGVVQRRAGGVVVVIETSDIARLEPSIRSKVVDHMYVHPLTPSKRETFFDQDDHAG